MTTLPCITARVGFDTQVLLQQAAAISGTSSHYCPVKHQPALKTVV